MARGNQLARNVTKGEILYSIWMSELLMPSVWGFQTSVLSWHTMKCIALSSHTPYPAPLACLESMEDMPWKQVWPQGPGQGGIWTRGGGVWECQQLASCLWTWGNYFVTWASHLCRPWETLWISISTDLTVQGPWRVCFLPPFSGGLKFLDHHLIFT